MSAFQSTAYLLVSHGSRDPRPQAAMNRLAHLVRERLLEHHDPSLIKGNDPDPVPPAFVRTSQRHSNSIADISRRLTPLVGTACLELAVVPLHQQILEFSQRAQAAGMKRVRIVPMFLLKGVHVMDDIPAEVEQARQQIDQRIVIEICPHLGSHPGLKKLLQHRIQAAKTNACLLLSHGSRRPGGNYVIEKLAQELKAEVAFWSVPPHLESQIVKMMQSGHPQLTILPYFLFPGGITDAITRVTEDIAERFPKVRMHLLPPLGATRAIADLVTELAIYGSANGGMTSMPMPLIALRY